MHSSPKSFMSKQAVLEYCNIHNQSARSLCDRRHQSVVRAHSIRWIVHISEPRVTANFRLSSSLRKTVLSTLFVLMRYMQAACCSVPRTQVTASGEAKRMCVCVYVRAHMGGSFRIFQRQ